jgi:hypothetical protein
MPFGGQNVISGQCRAAGFKGVPHPTQKIYILYSKGLLRYLSRDKLIQETAQRWNF